MTRSTSSSWGTRRGTPTCVCSPTCLSAPEVPLERTHANERLLKKKRKIQ
uniref:Uncharacterized protein n=1 Tax=Triticum urartu TaxID=4572 RepID=A0A8R7PMB5_TRIUA